MTDILGNQLNLNLGLLLPEIILAATAVLVVLIDMFMEDAAGVRRVLPIVTIVGLLLAGLLSVTGIDQQVDFARLVQIDNFTTFFRFLFIAVAIVLIAGSHEYISRYVNHIGEFYALLLLSTVGAMFMASARDLLVAYLGIEVLSFSL